MLFFNNQLKNNIDFLKKFSDNINDKYIESIQNDKYNKTIFHCIDNRWNTVYKNHKNHKYTKKIK